MERSFRGCSKVGGCSLLLTSGPGVGTMMRASLSGEASPDHLFLAHSLGTTVLLVLMAIVHPIIGRPPNAQPSGG